MSVIFMPLLVNVPWLIASYNDPTDGLKFNFLWLLPL